MSARPSKHTILYAIRTNRPAEVHLAFGVARRTLVRWCEDLGIDVPAVPHAGGCKKGQQIGGGVSRRPDRETWLADCAVLTKDELRQKHGISAWTVWNWCKHYGIPVPGGRGPVEKGEAAPEPTPTVPTPEPVPAPAAATPLPPPVSIPRLAPGRPNYWCQPNIGSGST